MSWEEVEVLFVKSVESTAADSEELAIFHLITVMQRVRLLAMIEFIFVSTIKAVLTTKSADMQLDQKAPSPMCH